jgi:uncharacterized protein YdhG (YjbR/CyaY superfamily)
MNQNFSNVEEYIKSFPENIQYFLNNIRTTILENAPNATEEISYGMPAYKINKKPLVYFGAFSKHIGFYATPTGHKEFKEQLSQYKQGKGSVQFPYKKLIPYELIAKIVKFRVNENKKINKK